MSRVVGLHPDALFDREAEGVLTDAERARLDAHLESCATCRFERQLRLDFADELAGEATPSERLALAGLSSSPPPAVTEPSGQPIATEIVIPMSRPRRGMKKWTTWLLVAAAVLGVSAAGATGVGQRAWLRLVGPDPAPLAMDAPAPRETATHTSPRRTASAPPVIPSDPAREAPSADVLIVPPPAAPPPPVVHHVASEGAATLFESATTARRQGSYARAIDLQRELVAHFPRSREAHVARETLGRLLLDRGDPAGAVASFDAYLADGSGELGEEAMFGRATALERLGRTSLASDAWRALLAAYPETPYASHAKSRLGSLSVR